MEENPIVSVIALLMSIVALSITILQVLQQYYSSAVGYVNCNERVMGLWANYTRRKFRMRELRFEVLFEAPVIFVAPPSNRKGPVPGRDIWYVDGSDKSYEETRTMKPDAEKNDRDAAQRSVHTSDHERASWVTLLAALQTMEQDSTTWNKKVNSNRLQQAAPTVWNRTLAVAVQSKTRSWDSMENVKKPYATTTICHLIEIVAMLGLHWKEFNREENRYRAEGNGCIVTGSKMPELGLTFTFERTGKSRYEENRPIPVDEAKELCFGFVPTIFRDAANTRFPVDLEAIERDFPLGTLRMGSADEVAETLMLIGCDTNTVDLCQRKKNGHLFPVDFELIGMLAKTLRLRSTSFRYVPNPTFQRWNKKSMSLPRLLSSFRKNLLVLHDDPGFSNGESGQMGAILAHLDALDNRLQDAQDHSIHNRPWPFEELHDAIDNADDYLSTKTVTRQTVFKVLRLHLQAVVEDLNSPESTLEQLKWEWPEQRESQFMEIYIHRIRCEVLRNVHQPSPYLGARAKHASPDIMSSPVQSTALELHGNEIWCTLLFRMLCWLLLHDFHKTDVQIPKSELLGSRQPVYIA